MKSSDGGGKQGDEKLVEDASAIVEKASSLGIVLRLMGAAAVETHVKMFRDLYHHLGRLGGGRRFTDVDLVSYRVQASKVHRLMTKELGYNVDRRFVAYFGNQRFLYHHPDGAYDVDVFFDKLEFSHDIHLGLRPGKGRLELDYPTLGLADLVLEKTQIHEITEKDVKDLVALLREHGLSRGEELEKVNLDRVAKVLAEDWGFWYDAKIALTSVMGFTQRYAGKGLISREDSSDVEGKIDVILKYIEAEPKTEGWKRRARVGIARKWWRDVEELVR
jgi:hypothetical protein